MTTRPAPRFLHWVWAALTVSLGLIFFYAGGLRLGSFLHMQAYGGWPALFSVTPKELGYYLYAILFLLPACIVLAVAFQRSSNGEFGRYLSIWSDRIDERLFLGICAFVFLGITFVVHSFVLKGVGLTDDEGVYLFQARLLLSGKLFISPPPDAGFFRNHFIINANGRWFPVYPWLHPLFLALGVFLRRPAVIAPCLGLGTMVLTFKLSKELLGKPLALAATAMFVLSPFAQYMAATFLSQSTSALMVVLLMYAYTKLERTQKKSWALIAGLALGGVLNSRPLTALAAGSVVAAFGIGRLLASRGAFIRVAWPAIPAALGGVAVYLLMGWLTEGSSASPTPFVHGVTGILGFATLDPKVYNSSPQLSFLVLADYLMKLNAWAFGWPCSLLFVFVALLKPLACRPIALPLTWIGALFAAYFFCRFPCVDDIGPVYVFDALPFVVIATVFGMKLLGDTLARLEPAQGEVPALLGVAFFALSMPVFQRIQAITLKALATTIAAPLQLVKESGLHQALVFMSNRNAPRATGWVYYPPPPNPDFSDDVLYVRDLNEQADAAFASRFKERVPFRLRKDLAGQWHLARLGSPEAKDDALNLESRRAPPIEPASVPLIPVAE